MPVKAITLPEPPGSPTKSEADIFETGAYSVIRRALIIGNGVEDSENQSIGLVHALGMSEKHVLHRVTRPRGGINEWLLWLPVSVHKKVIKIISQLSLYSKVVSKRSEDKFLPLNTKDGNSAGLSSILEADVKNIVTMAQDSSGDGPLLIVACGRDTISITRSIKELASDKVFIVQIQQPRSRLNRFDLVITPEHDYYPLTPSAEKKVPNFMQKWIPPREPPDRNVVLTVGALHQVDSASLRTAALTWHDEFVALPKPILVVTLGGPTRFCSYGADLAKQLVASLHNVLSSCGSVKISFSRRTPKQVSDFVLKELGSSPKVFIWDSEEPSLYMGHLAWADAFIVSADSVRMISETCSTGKPVYVVGGENCSWKHAEFHKLIRERGLVRPLTGLEDISKSWSYPPLNDTAEAANRVREALAERGWRLLT
ncbi:hypothetical protein ACET3Z_012430 [Daucus carota]